MNDEYQSPAILAQQKIASYIIKHPRTSVGEMMEALNVTQADIFGHAQAKATGTVSRIRAAFEDAIRDMEGAQKKQYFIDYVTKKEPGIDPKIVFGVVSEILNEEGEM